MTNTVFAAVVAAAATLMASEALAAPFPNAGADMSGPEYTITANPGGTFTTVQNPAYLGIATPYDGVEDTYFGVINHSNNVLPSFFLSSTTLPIFGFEGDGINGYVLPAAIPNNSLDTTGYGGPLAHFTGISSDFMSGTVVFGPTGLPAGEQTFFSLEDKVTLSTIAVSGGVPEPSTWAMMLIGFAGLGFLAYRKANRRNNGLVQA